MSELKTNQYRYHIAYLLNDYKVGAKFAPTELHITVLPWFALEADEGPFLNWFYKHFDEVNTFEAVAASRAMFGPKLDVPVSIMEPTDKFMSLHQTALSWFGAVGARWAERDPYVGDDYIPHVAQRRGYVIEEGQTFRISSLILFKANRREDHIRIVAAKAQFRENQS
jgi:hypothetical protein